VENMTFAHIVLASSLGLLFYTYIGYPALLTLLALFRRDVGAGHEDPVSWPSVTVVISAFNEEAVIGRRIQNLLELDYPRDRLQILVGSDGSTDGTCDVVTRYRFAGVKLVACASRRGKAGVLNELVSRATGEFVVFTDANTFYDHDAIKELIRGFQVCHAACAVVGRLEFRTSSGAVNPDGLYWRYESLLKKLESHFGTLLGANGAIYAIRRTLYHPLPPGTIVDDFLIPLLMRLDGGGAVVFRPSAKAWELTPETVRDEFHRRVRIGAGDAHALMHSWRLLYPTRGMLAFSYWSHKVFRWLGPGLLLAALISNLFLLNAPWGRGLFILQLFGYALALSAPLVHAIPLLGRVTTAISYFIILNAALLIGFVRFFLGMTGQTWQTTPRTAEAALSSSHPLAEGKRVGEGHETRPAV
jgi:cellulose synthase/poly-beta-1,6-N-acetylglucosamine synthase-like glycosyltransferase